MSDAIVELRDVFCVHRTNEGDAAALQGMNLALGHGEVLSILGPSGAGKSTILRVAAGFQQPSAGVVRVAGRDIGRLPARSRSRVRHELMGFLGQHPAPALEFRLRVLAGGMSPTPGGEMLEGASFLCRVDELLEVTGLADRADALPGGTVRRRRPAVCPVRCPRPPAGRGCCSPTSRPATWTARAQTPCAP